VVHVFDKNEYVEGDNFSLLRNGLISYYNRKENKSIVLNLRSKKVINAPNGFTFGKFYSTHSEQIVNVVTQKNRGEENMFSLIKMELLFKPNGKNNEYTAVPYDNNSIFIYNYQMPIGIYTKKGIKLFED
jgi:hypothetical protein